MNTRGASIFAVLVPAALLLGGCEAEDEPEPRPEDVVTVSAAAETPPVPDADDAADDPAIWLNRENPAASLIIGTNKRRGLEVYDLAGSRVSSLDLGRVNNVDLREVELFGETVIVVAATNRTHEGLDVLRLNPETGALEAILAEPIASPFSDEIYGLCMHRDAQGRAHVIANGKGGGFAQWVLEDAGGETVRGALVREFSVESQPEGCAADDAAGFLFVGEEARGVWRFPLDPSVSQEPVLIARTGLWPDGAGRISADVEGVAIYAPEGARADAGYLVVSSQGNFTYVVYDRAPPHAYRGTFAIEAGAGVDGAEETDGLDVVSADLGAAYPQGLLVVQDGYNRTAEGEDEHQNFKYVSWAEIDTALGLSPPLMTMVGPGGAEIPVTDAWLDGLPQTTIETSTPWTVETAEFSGVPAEAVFDRIGAEDGRARVLALDDYAVSIDIADVVALGGVFARAMNGEPLDPETTGPLWLIYPYDELDAEARARAVSGMSPWAIDRIEIDETGEGG